MFGLAEAKALIIRHRDVVLTIAMALMVHRTFDAVMIHVIFVRAPERARRADWARTCANASLFSRTIKRPMQTNAACLAAWCLRLPHRLAASTANCAEPHFATDHFPTQLTVVCSVQDSARECDVPL
jgi:hypothetical protein